MNVQRKLAIFFLNILTTIINFLKSTLSMVNRDLKQQDDSYEENWDDPNWNDNVQHYKQKHKLTYTHKIWNFFDKTAARITYERRILEFRDDDNHWYNKEKEEEFNNCDEYEYNMWKEHGDEEYDDDDADNNSETSGTINGIRKTHEIIDWRLEYNKAEQFYEKCQYCANRVQPGHQRCHECQTNIQRENWDLNACVRLDDNDVKCGKPLAAPGISRYRLCVECEHIRKRQRDEYHIRIPEYIHPIVKIKLYEMELDKRAIYQRRYHLPFSARHYLWERNLQRQIDKCLQRIEDESDTIWRLSLKQKFY